MRREDIVNGRLENEPVTLVNIYIPPESGKKVFKTLFDVLAVESKGTLICGGDLHKHIIERDGDCRLMEPRTPPGKGFHSLFSCS